MLPYFERKKLGDIDLGAVMEWIDEQRAAGELSDASIRHNMNLLSRFFSWAIARGKASINPVRQIPMGSRPTQSVKSDQGRRSGDEILAGFTRTSTAIPRSTTIVLVDDNMQSGNSIAALDRLLGATRPTCAFAVAVTDSRPSADALKTRGFTIAYDDEGDVLDVRCTLDQVR